MRSVRLCGFVAKVAWVLQLIALAMSTPASSRELEIDVQRKFCAGLPTNERLSDNSEVDCIGSDVALEVDFTEHWAEAIGQALHYGAVMGIRPGIILVCRTSTPQSTCLRHQLRLEETMSYWNIGMVVWFCRAADASLAHCRHKDFFGPD